nr:hypothetical protein MarFTME_048 [Marseillevirus futianmevirus]
MEDFLAPRELISLSVVSDDIVSPDKFKRVVVSDKTEWTDSRIEKKEVLPDGTLHGTFKKEKQKGSRVWGATKTYKFGELDGAFSLWVVDVCFRRKLFGEFVDGIAHGVFTFSFEELFSRERRERSVLYEKGLPKSITKNGESQNFYWRKKTLLFKDRKFTKLYLSKKLFPTSENFFPLGKGHTWAAVSLGKCGKYIYGRNEKGALCRIWLPIFCDKIF